MADKPSVPTVAELTDKPGATAADLQFPSLAGKPGVEVAERTADTDRATATQYEKVFVLLKRQWETCDQEAIHEANRIAVRQFLTDNGLRTDKVDVEFVGTEEPPPGINDGLPERKHSIGLRYRVPALPAVLVATPGLVSETNLPDDVDLTLVKR
jgi:hypothetical protein